MAEAARPKYEVSILIEPPFRGRLARAALRRLAVRVLRGEGVAPPAEVGLVVTDDETVRDLNRRYRCIDEPTDVLSFGYGPFDPSASLRAGRLRTQPVDPSTGSGCGGSGTEPFVTPPDGVRRLGEVIVSYPTAERQALEAGHSVQEEAAHLVVHGLLHLLGYDHEDPDDERRMRARKVELLGQEAH
jgi:probable rRNA maturation factor